MDSCLFTLVFGLSMLGGCLARVVTVSPGPLIRVEGQTVSIRCDVNDYSGPSEQDFDWMMSKEANGKKMNIISTIDAGYSDPSISKRVASGDISVARLKDNEVELKIAEVKSTDAGFYWCQTPSTDSVASGNYDAKVQLTVILNTLKVSPLTPPPVVPEGSDLTLSCNVTRELTLPTYLSVTWSLKRGATSEEILTFGPQGICVLLLTCVLVSFFQVQLARTFSPRTQVCSLHSWYWETAVVTGAKYTRRYADGGIRLVPGKNGFFELVISKVTTSDEGIYECNGTEWTYENGGKWIKIVESTKEMGTVAVIPTENLLGINTWICMGAKGGLVVVLIIVVIVCCVHTKRKKRMQLKDEGELRLAWTNDQQHQHHQHHQHQHNHPPDPHHHRCQQQPAGHTGPRQHRSKQHREQQHLRPLDPPSAHPQPPTTCTGPETS
ncbi:immunoglobulin superfamily member 8-like [Sander lucioperca]|uniref:immunoglobulin superfamily member 8-like n=1 Tax=Sander lucioperca TaxID=283035 RepID=UPI00125D2C8D|nr:immunoglobulin superfamily member 8-like [Sander lucioperca]